MSLLQAKWDLCKSTQAKVQAPTLVHQESDSSETTIRDYFHDEVDSVWVDDRDEHKTIANYLGVLSADQVSKVKLYTGDLSLFDHFGIEEELEKTFMRKVPLKRGGYLVIDRAEALTAIDVNTGGKVRGRDQAKNILETNMDSAWEVAKQMRLRDLGGLIVIDFIDMDDEESRENVVKEFKKAIRQDKSPISFSSISQFGLMEVTRKRIRPDAVQEQSNACPTCHGAGYVPSKESVVGHIDRWLRRFRAKKGDDQLSLVLHPDMISHVLENRAAIFKYWERMHKCRIQLVEDDDANFAEYRFFNRQNDDITATNTLS
jgi:ribonuclease G